MQGALLMRMQLPLGPYGRPMPRALWWSYGGGRLVSEVPLCESLPEETWILFWVRRRLLNLLPFLAWNLGIQANPPSVSSWAHVPVCAIQGYLAHQKMPPTRTLHQAYAKGPMVVCVWGVGFL